MSRSANPLIIVLQSRQAGQHLHEREAYRHNPGRPIHQLRRNGLGVVPLPCLSMRQTLCGVRYPQYAGRQAPARPHCSRRMTPFRPCICFAGHTWTQTHGQRKEGNLWISLLVCFCGEISADRELNLQRSLQKTDLRIKTTRLARQVTRRSTGEGSASFRHLSAFLHSGSFLQQASIQAASS